MDSDKLIVRFISDIHTELDNKPELPTADIYVLAGDIGAYDNKHKLIQYLKYVSTLAPIVIYVLGNHEYYGTTIQDGYDQIKSLINDAGIKNIHLLEKQVLILENNGKKLTFVACTLWTKVKPDIIEHVNDYKCIKNDNDNKSSYDRMIKEHDESVQFLKSALESYDNNGILIVVTHHMPHLTEDESSYKASVYRVDMSDLMKENMIWIYGHTHKAMDRIINGCRCVTNPHGYPQEIQTSGFNPDAHLVLTWDE